MRNEKEKEECKSNDQLQKHMRHFKNQGSKKNHIERVLGVVRVDGGCRGQHTLESNCG